MDDEIEEAKAKLTSAQLYLDGLSAEDESHLKRAGVDPDRLRNLLGRLFLAAEKIS